MLKGFEEAFVAEKKQISVTFKDKTHVFYAEQLGVFAMQLVIQKVNEQRLSLNAMLIAESVSDAEGNKFTYEEVLRMRKEAAEPFLKAIGELYGLGLEEKN